MKLKVLRKTETFNVPLYLKDFCVIKFSIHTDLSIKRTKTTKDLKHLTVGDVINVVCQYLLPNIEDYCKVVDIQY